MRTTNLRNRCAAVVLDLNNRLANNSNGSLIQVWLPEVSENNRMVLSTQGLPYAVAGIGDLLALFRCVSCQFNFSTDIMRPRLLGAIGRVYTTSEPEICADVQKYDKQIYLRVSEAQRCRVHSTVVIPFFDSAERRRALGVIEVVKNDKGISFTDLLENIVISLEIANLCTSDVDMHQIEEGLKQWPVDSDLRMFDLGYESFPNPTSSMPLSETSHPLSQAMATNPISMDAMIHPAVSLSDEPHQHTAPDGRERMSSFFNVCTRDAQDYVDVPHAFLGADAVGLQHPSLLSGHTSNGVANMAPMKHMTLLQQPTGSMYPAPPEPLESLVDLEERNVPGLIGMAHTNAGGMFQAMPPPGLAEENDQTLDRGKLEELLHTLTSNRFRRQRRRKMGSGKHLTYQDLQEHFGVGLKQAAATLGICPTTLKRACRRNGIDRWPSRHGRRTAPRNNASLQAILTSEPVPSLDTHSTAPRSVTLDNACSSSLYMATASDFRETPSTTKGEESS